MSSSNQSHWSLPAWWAEPQRLAVVVQGSAALWLVYLLEVRDRCGASEGFRHEPLRAILPGGARGAQDALALGHEQRCGPEEFVVAQVQTHGVIITYR
jgi:hypothetical protein